MPSTSAQQLKKKQFIKVFGDWFNIFNQGINKERQFPF